MATIYDVAASYREQLLALDRAAARRMADAYRPVYSALQGHLKEATDELERIRQDPEATPLDIQKALFKSDRYRAMYSAARDELQRYNAIARGIILDTQMHAIDLGATHMDGLIKSLFKDNDAGQAFTFARPDTEAMQAMVGFASNGSPLASLFEGIAPEALGLARDVLVQGIGLGTSPVVIGKQLAGPLGLPAWRGLTIARTETLRAYREAQRQTVMANDDVLEGWVWTSARDRRTCEVCWSMDGKVFPITNDTRVAADVPGHQAMEPATVAARDKQLQDYNADMAAAKQRWITPGEDFAIRTAASSLAYGQPAPGQVGRDAELLMSALNRAAPVSDPIYRGEQLARIPEVGSSIRRVLSSWGNAASAEGYAQDPAGAAVYGQGQTGHKVVLEMRGARAVPMPDLDEYMSGGQLRVVSSRNESGVTYLTVQQIKTFEPRKKAS